MLKESLVSMDAAAHADMRPALTKRQKSVLNAITAYIRKHGYPPSRNDLCKQFGFKSPNATQDHLGRLVKKGYITIAPGIARGIKVMPHE